MRAMSRFGVATLCLLEALERCAYYCMLGVLTLSWSERLSMSTAESYSYLGLFTGSLLPAALIAGLLADRVLSPARALWVAAALLGPSYALLGHMGPSGLTAMMLLLALCLSLFKVSARATLAGLYPQDHPGRDFGFIGFGLATQVGAFFSPFAAGLTRQGWGFDGVFLLCSGLLLLGALLTFAVRRRLVAVPATSATSTPAAPVHRVAWSLLVPLLLIWMLHETAAQLLGMALPTWAMDHADLRLGGWLAQPLDPLQLAIGLQLPLAAPVCGLFLMLRRRGRVLSAPGKVGLGMVLSTVPSLILWRAALSTPDGGQVSGLWVLGACVALALPGLFLVPVLLSLLSRLLPQRRMATFFGVWTALAGLVNMVSRELGILYWRWEPERYFAALGLAALAATLLWISQVRRTEAALLRLGAA